MLRESYEKTRMIEVSNDRESELSPGETGSRRSAGKSDGWIE